MSIFRAAASILANTKSPAAVREILRKGYFRIFAESDSVDVAAELAKSASNFDEWAKATNSDAYEEAVKFNAAHAEHHRAFAKKIGIPMGGAAHLTLGYFLVRAFRPKTVVETGVAAGHSSRAFLHALQQNNDGGSLYSSDFPYLKEKNAEEYIGIIVEDNIRDNWNLMIEGDRTNLAKINKLIPGSIDLFHYDSDKTKSGRNFALDTLKAKLVTGSMVVFDDIQDNDHFIIWSKQFANRHVFKIDEKYVGMVII